MDDLTLINNTSVYRTPAPQSPLQGQNVMQPAAVYSKIMLRTIELAESDYTFDGVAVERSMPSNNGSNEIVFKRMLSLAAHTQPLVEGIPPASDQGRMVAIKATANSYGRVMKFTDKVNWAVIDPLIAEYTRQLSLKVPETKDLLAQEALLAECQMYYAQPKKLADNSEPDIRIINTDAPAVTHISEMTQDCSPTIDEFRKIVLSMEAAKVRPYQGSNFLVLTSSAVLFDLITDKRVKEFMKYENTGRAYSNDMVIDLFSLAFKKAKTIKSDNTYIDGDGRVRYLYTDGDYNYALLSPLSDHTKVAATAASGTEGQQGYVAAVPEHYTAKAGDIRITLPALNGGSYSAYSSSTFSSNEFDITKDADILNLHYSFVLGEECLYRIGVEGHTAPQFIKKELGSAGTEDPLNQRQSIGWKIDSIGYKVPNPDAVVAYISVPTQYKINMNQRPDLKNQFTNYNYGFKDAAGNFYYPEQVIQTVVSGEPKYFVRGTATEVTAQTMTNLVKPVNGGRIMSDGTKAKVVGTTPTAAFVLVSSLNTGTPIRFTADQVTKGLYNDTTSNPNVDYRTHYYIKGLEGTAAAAPVGAVAGTSFGAGEVVPLPETFTVNNGIEEFTGIDNGVSPHNLTGDSRIDS